MVLVLCCSVWLIGWWGLRSMQEVVLSAYLFLWPVLPSLLSVGCRGVVACGCAAGCLQRACNLVLGVCVGVRLWL